MRTWSATGLHLRYRFGHTADDFRAYGVTTGERSAAEAEGLLGFTWMRDVARPALNAASGGLLTQDKWVFYRLMDGFGIPIPPTLGLYDPVYGVTWDGRRRLRTREDVAAEVERRRPAGLVLKPSGGQQGKGLVIVDEIDHASGRVVVRGGRWTSLVEVLAGIDVAGLGGLPGYIVQELAAAHPVYHALAPWTANTIRVITLLDRAGEAHVLAAVTVLGRRGQLNNLWRGGGVNVGIDVETGLMGRGLLFQQPGSVTTHPDSGLEFTGTPVPDWADVAAICRRAAGLLPGTRTLGWDVLATPGGPVILEANDTWRLSTIQVHGPGFLADDRIRTALADAGAPLPTGQARDLLTHRLRGLPRRLKSVAERVERWAPRP
jgi:Sugar-transfer associated ATP-grasp